MGWFDKKSWQLRRKIRDLQSELAVAEREGKYVVEQGLFFAELHEMGDATMMVLGTADHLDSQEEEIIRNFFDRNGFTVEHLRLDRAHKTLTAVELIPPEELTRRVAKLLKEKGYRLVDDSEQERQPNLEKQVITLSAIIRAISSLFTAHVHQLVISTPLKMNMEGNRLLHWAPLIWEALLKKVPGDVVNLCRDPFISAYNHYYGQFGQMADTENFHRFTDEPSDVEPPLQESSSPVTETQESESSADSQAAPWNSDTSASANPEGETTDTITSASPHTAESNSLKTHEDATEAAQTLAKIYKSLIGASGERRVRNAETVLEHIRQFYHAGAVCLISRKDIDAPFKLHANAGKPQCMQTGEDGTIEPKSSIVHSAVESNKIVTNRSERNGYNTPLAVAIPVEADSKGEAVLYIVEPGRHSTGSDSDFQNALVLAQVFREFPDLILPGNFS